MEMIGWEIVLLQVPFYRSPFYKVANDSFASLATL